MVHKLKGQYIIVPHEVFGERVVVLLTVQEYNKGLRRVHLAGAKGISLEGKKKMERYGIVI